MRVALSRILALVAILLLVAAAFQLVSLLGSARAERTRESNENPPEDWFVTQRVTHGGIPAGAFRLDRRTEWTFALHRLATAGSGDHDVSAR